MNILRWVLLRKYRALKLLVGGADRACFGILLLVLSWMDQVIRDSGFDWFTVLVAFDFFGILDLLFL